MRTRIRETQSTTPALVARRPGPIAALALVLALGLALASCARNPVTGRPDPVLTTEEGEIKQGNEAAKMVEEYIGLVPDADLEKYVETLGLRLARHSPRTNLTHWFHVVEMKEPNAFALPGGHIYVSRGLLALCNSEDELAAVIGHEIGHVAARHSVQRQAASAPLLPVRIAAGIGGAVASIVSPSIGKVVSTVGQLPGALALARYSRDQEREADRLGQQFAAAAGFDPEALASFMESLSREEALQGNDPNRTSFLQSHPASPERAKDATAYAEELTIAKGQPAPLSRRAFFDVIDGLAVNESAAEGVFVEDQFLHPDLAIGLTFPKDWEYKNSRRMVVAQQKDQLAYLVLEIADEGSDPMESALAFDKEVRLDEAPRRLDVNGLKAVEATARVGGGGEARSLYLAWVAHDEKIYRVMGVSSPRHFEPLEPTFWKTARSFRVLTKSELRQIHQDRLRIVTMGAKEDLEQLAKRTDNQWSVEQTRVANAVPDGAAPASGSLVKIARSERYVPRPPEKKAETPGAQ